MENMCKTRIYVANVWCACAPYTMSVSVYVTMWICFARFFLPNIYFHIVRYCWFLLFSISSTRCLSFSFTFSRTVAVLTTQNVTSLNCISRSALEKFNSLLKFFSIYLIVCSHASCNSPFLRCFLFATLSLSPQFVDEGRKKSFLLEPIVSSFVAGARAHTHAPECVAQFPLNAP